MGDLFVHHTHVICLLQWIKPLIMNLRPTFNTHTHTHTFLFKLTKLNKMLVDIHGIAIIQALRPGSIPLSEASSVLPQHLSSRSYSQPALSYEQLANIIGYPSMTQSYSPAPSTLQQAYLGGSAFQQSVAGMDYNFPQYRSGASVSRLPPSAAAVGGHGNFGASNNVHGSFLQNASAAPVSMSDYDDALRARYKDGSHLTPLHQVEMSILIPYLF